jgi:type I restriction enzyme S subunit
LSVYNLNDGDEVCYNRVYHITNERYEESPEIMVKAGDVLLTKDGAGIGKLGYVKDLPQSATINSSLLLIRPSSVAISKYIFYLLSGPQLQSIVKERITGSATPHLFQKDIKEFFIPIPPMEEQKEIVSVLDAVLSKENTTYETAKNVISQIDLIKKSILSKAFRGELGTNIETEESSIELLRNIIGDC